MLVRSAAHRIVISVFQLTDEHVSLAVTSLGRSIQCECADVSPLVLQALLCVAVTFVVGTYIADSLRKQVC